MYKMFGSIEKEPESCVFLGERNRVMALADELGSESSERNRVMQVNQLFMILLERMAVEIHRSCYI
jgi:hypothetical protein